MRALGSLLGALGLAAVALFFGALAVVALITDGWPGLVMTVVAGGCAWIVALCAKMSFDEWWEDR